jgi:hypothetical protein
LEELVGHHGADGVAPDIVRPRRAATVPIEARYGLRRAGQQLAADDVHIRLSVHDKKVNDPTRSGRPKLFG